MLSAKFMWMLVGICLVADSLLRFLLLCLRAITRSKSQSTDISCLDGSAASAGCIVLIAAHNEAGTIGATVAAVAAQLREWPGSGLWVVADRCDDATAEEAAAAGARVAVRTAAGSNGRLGKCAVIAWWLEHYESEWRSRDAVVIQDADSRLRTGSLGAIRQAMSDREVAVAQCFVAPDAGTSSGRLAGWSEVLMQRIDDEARRRRGWSVPLRGTGMAFRGKVLAELAPRLHTLAEDLELDILLAAAGRRVAFVPEAVVFDPKPSESKGASRQRARWLQGQLQVLGAYSREIIQALMKGGLGAWFLIALLIMRPKILFIGLRALALGLSLLFPASFPLFGFAVAGLTMDLSYYLAGAAFVDRPRRYALDLVAAPRYAAIWVYSLGIAAFQRAFRRGHRVWLRAGRLL
jgi:cellulose synthase/poly-beta-1,6-N-acetylglucosamine synthase-like glycosyltransferase